MAATQLINDRLVVAAGVRRLTPVVITTGAVETLGHVLDVRGEHAHVQVQGRDAVAAVGLSQSRGWVHVSRVEVDCSPGR